MIEQFVANDLLQLKTNRLLPKLLWPLEKSENALLQQNRIAALLNAIVSFKDGRKYFDGISMVETLSAVATGNSSIERNTLDNLIAVMGKLSINAHHRLDFAKKGLQRLIFLRQNLEKHLIQFVYQLQVYWIGY